MPASTLRADLVALAVGVAAIITAFVVQPAFAWLPLILGFAAIVTGVLSGSSGHDRRARWSITGAALGLASVIIVGWWFGGWLR